MSHIEQVGGPPSITLAPGQSIDYEVIVSGVPGDDQAVVRWTASDGSTGTAQITTDRADLEGLLSGTPKANQIVGEVVSGSGTLTSLGAVTGGWKYRYTAA